MGGGKSVGSGEGFLTQCGYCITNAGSNGALYTSRPCLAGQGKPTRPTGVDWMANGRRAS
jgi:hypothetical protein